MIQHFYVCYWVGPPPNPVLEPYGLVVLLELYMISAQGLDPPTEKLHGIERCVVSVAGRTLLNKQVNTLQ